MTEIKFVINDPKTGKSYAKVQPADFSGLKIGDTIAGNLLGLTGFEFQITGGSDTAGFPMRKEINTPNRKSAYIGSGPGIHTTKKGMKIRKTVRGNTIGPHTVQINIKIMKHGTEAIENVLGSKEKPKDTPEKRE